MQTEGYNVAYVGNVAFDASKDQLKEVFQDCRVAFVRLHTDKVTGNSKGFAHVHFEDEESLDRFDDSSLHLSFSVPTSPSDESECFLHTRICKSHEEYPK